MERDELAREVEELHRASFGWALACCGRRRDDAEDVLQTTYLKIMEGRARFDGRSELKTWLFGVIRRTAAEHFRRRARRRLGRVEATRRWPLAETPSPGERLETSRRATELLEALATLPERQREIVELVFYHEMTIEEAASVIGVSLGTARTHYHRAKKNLSKRLTEARANAS